MHLLYMRHSKPTAPVDPIRVIWPICRHSVGAH